VSDPATFWDRKVQLLEKAWKAFRQDAPGGARDLAGVVDQIALAARAVRDRRLARRARRIRQRISKLAALQSRRELLSRMGRLGVLAAEAAAGLEVRWEELSRERAKCALRETRGRTMRRFRRALERRQRKGDGGIGRRLEHAHERCTKGLAPLGDDSSEGDLSRYRAALGKARDYALALEEAGRTRPKPAEREIRVADALDRWHDLRSFRKTLSRERRRAERRGVVTLALELDGLISTLDRTLGKARQEALRSARPLFNVVSFGKRSA
jgi:hypothetical protein